tara:strand:- start:90093 stop:90800 length:708 start_codon:yes stop_codon:yes gene_type:complete
MKKIFLFFVVLIFHSNFIFSQSGRINLSGYDDVKTHFGFLLGLHSSYYRFDYSADYISPDFSDLHSIHSKSLPGFKLGFISDFSLYYPFDLRTLLQVSFSEFRMDYYYLDGSVFSDIRPSTFLESPILLKYKSKRRKNHRMFIIAGLKPSLEIGAKNKDEAGKDILDLRSFDVSFELGFGSDIFFQLFKLSPEIRYSRGLRNILNKKNLNIYNRPIDKIIVHNISFFFTFEGGPK